MDLLLDNVEPPEGTTEIDEGTFHNHRLIASVKIPPSVIVIGENAFTNCVNLRYIKIPSTVMAIKKRAFANCVALNWADLPAGLTILEESVFEGCDNLESVTLPDSITTLKHNAFAGCTGIKSLVIPDNLISCAATSFPSQKFLTINKVYKYRNGMMINTANNMLLYYNGNDEEITTPPSVKGIAYRAFAGSSVSTVRLSSTVTSIGDEAFYGMKKNAKVIIQDSVDFIENSAFGENVKILCKKSSYAENWCAANSAYKQLKDEEI